MIMPLGESTICLDSSPTADNSGERDVTSLFTEFAIPVFENLDSQFCLVVAESRGLFGVVLVDNLLDRDRARHGGAFAERVLR